MENKKQIVVVITRGVVWFRNWVNENNNPNCKYIHAHNLKSVQGIVPNTIVKLEDYYLVSEIGEVLKYLNSRLIILKPMKRKLSILGLFIFPLFVPIWLFWKKSDRKDWNEFKTDIIYLK